MDMVNPISIRSGSDIPRSEFSDLPRALSLFYFDGEISAEQSTNFHITIFYIILRVSEGKKMRNLAIMELINLL